MARYINTTETAALIRQELKAAFPGITFSVRKDSYTGRAGIDVRWMDGPARFKVQDVLKIFKRATYNGLKRSSTIYKGEEVWFSAMIHCFRNESSVFIDELVAAYYKEFGHDIPFLVEVRGSYVETFRLTPAQEAWFHHAREVTDAAPKTKKKYKSTYKSKATKAREEYEAFQKQYAAEQHQREQEYIRREQDRLRAERERQHEEERQQERKRREAKRAPKGFTEAEALAFFGLASGASIDEIKRAFRKMVKDAADGHGGYNRDMDILTRYKEAAMRV